jgi:hypothetical protein
MVPLGEVRTNPSNAEREALFKIAISGDGGRRIEDPA